MLCASLPLATLFPGKKTSAGNPACAASPAGSNDASGRSNGVPQAQRNCVVPPEVVAPHCGQRNSSSRTETDVVPPPPSLTIACTFLRRRVGAVALLEDTGLGARARDIDDEAAPRDAQPLSPAPQRSPHACPIVRDHR